MSYSTLGLIAAPRSSIAGPTRPLLTRPTMDAVLASRPTDAEILSIASDFNLKGLDKMPDARLNLINMFRCMKALTFDSMMPVLGVNNLYYWLRSLGLAWSVVPGMPVIAQAALSYIHLRADYVGGAGMKRWSDPARANGMLNLIATVVHEARHTLPAGGLPHNCGGDGPSTYVADSSLAYGGAYAAQHWFLIWCARHSGDQLSPAERHDAELYASLIRFCTPTPPVRGTKGTLRGLFGLLL